GRKERSDPWQLETCATGKPTAEDSVELKSSSLFSVLVLPNRPLQGRRCDGTEEPAGVASRGGRRPEHREATWRNSSASSDARTRAASSSRGTWDAKWSSSDGSTTAPIPA